MKKLVISVSVLVMLCASALADDQDDADQAHTNAVDAYDLQVTAATNCSTAYTTSATRYSTAVDMAINSCGDCQMCGGCSLIWEGLGFMDDAYEAVNTLNNGLYDAATYKHSVGHSHYALGDYAVANSTWVEEADIWDEMVTNFTTIIGFYTQALAKFNAAILWFTN